MNFIGWGSAGFESKSIKLHYTPNCTTPPAPTIALVAVGGQPSTAIRRREEREERRDEREERGEERGDFIRRGTVKQREPVRMRSKCVIGFFLRVLVLFDGFCLFSMCLLIFDGFLVGLSGFW